MASNHVRNITIVGAGGSVGAFITRALVEQNKHTITALTRPDSTNKLPEGVHAVKKLAYDDHDALVAALQGQDALIITLSATAPPTTQSKLVDAAVAAGVPWIMPNEYGGIGYKADQALAADTIIGTRVLAAREYIERASREKNDGRTRWIGLANGFWYEFSLAGSTARFGFDFDDKGLELFDDGEVAIRTATWPLCGLAVARIFALPIEAETPGELSLNELADTSVPVSSFHVSQRDMFASVLRVTGDQESDWTITHEDSRERYARGKKMMQEGDMAGFGMLLYTRYFYPEYKGRKDNTLNARLGLPKEDLDEFTKVALQYHAENLLGQRYGGAFGKKK